MKEEIMHSVFKSERCPKLRGKVPEKEFRSKLRNVNGDLMSDGIVPLRLLAEMSLPRLNEGIEKLTSKPN